VLSRDEVIEDLGLMLRPAGGGIYTVSTGREAQLAVQRTIYGGNEPAEIQRAWRAALGRAASAQVVILGVPSDTGAGLVRGASYGPLALREAMLVGEPGFRAWAEREAIVDVGDVAVIPQLLHDEMVSESQLAASRAALYPGAAAAARLPVSPLSICERVVDHLLTLNPSVRILLIGGDHSVAWPMTAALARHRSRPWAIVQPDAHTDLLPERLGIKYCFATWAYHANELLGRGGRLVQVGIRASRHPREHWEKTYGVKQFWAHEIRERGEERALVDIAAHLRAIGVESVYFSNDIDGTDGSLAPSTGAAEPAGLSPDFVRALIGHLATGFEVMAADLVEVAPPVGSAEDSRRTVSMGASYLLTSLRALIASGRRP
jgi:guanidinobutyrase